MENGLVERAFIWENEFDDVNCCNVTVAQINYPNLNKQDSIEQIRSQSHDEGLI
jgi:hypothetical protein